MPSTFTHLKEILVDWNRLTKRIPVHLRGYLSEVNPKRLELISSGFKNPVLAITHSDASILNNNINLLRNISDALNSQLVHKFSGVKFIEPMAPEEQSLIWNLCDTFNAEVLDIINNERN